MALTKVEQLARFFQAKPNVWFSARDLEFAGRYAWRSRVSDLRHPPFNLRIDNRVRTLKGPYGHYRVSEYMLVVPQPSFIFSGE